MDNDGRPLYESDGMKYDLAMIAAQKEYTAWVNSRKKANGGGGITVYSRKDKDKD